MADKITFTKEEVEILGQARDILLEKYDEADFCTPAYLIVKPTFFAVEDAIDEILHNRYELDNIE